MTRYVIAFFAVLVSLLGLIFGLSVLKAWYPQPEPVVVVEPEPIVEPELKGGEADTLHELPPNSQGRPDRVRRDSTPARGVKPAPRAATPWCAGAYDPERGTNFGACP